VKFQENLTLQQFKVIQGNRSWLGSMESPQSPTCDILLVINCNFSRICYCFRDIHT